MDKIDYFPRGLVQPPGSFRFGQDALLLAALTERFHSHGKKDNVVELGCGCGAALFGLLLLWPDAQGVGIDFNEKLLAASRKNAELLHLTDRTNFSCADFTDRMFGESMSKKAASFDVAIANPPWQIKGRPAKTKLREHALRSSVDGVLEDFFRAAKFLLRNKGHFYLVLSSRTIAGLFYVLEKTGFGLRFMQPLRTSPAERICKRIFIFCQKDAKNDPQIFTQLNIMPGNQQAKGEWPRRVFQLHI